MSQVESIHAAFAEVMRGFNASPAIQFLKDGQFTIAHYKSYLRETYHYTKEDPQLQALASVYFRGSDRHMVKLFLRHAISEVGHDLAALKDLEALGEKPQEVFSENPLPATIALTSYPFFEINYRNPIAYLGYLFFLEHMPTQHGAIYAKALMGAGVPEAAMGFLKEHMHVDVGHNKLMEKYLAHLVHNQKDADAMIYSMHVTAQLFANMLWAAVERAEKPPSYGVCWEEVDRLKPEGGAAVAGEEADDHEPHHH
jgi:pyrroloquinoline quinone (PQQ) biosynthesis protein C